ncbi:MAG: isochorismate synthase [Bacteroidaceae bacterium]|nr:isochorismate synthase [Bacteroidaceae bacterium]
MTELSPYCNLDTIGELMACCIAKKIPFYACRYPGEMLCRCGVQVESRPQHTLCEGFNVVPFDIESDSPTFTISPDFDPRQLSLLNSLPARSVEEPTWNDADIGQEEYLDKVSRLVELMKEEELSKVVLSRTITRTCDVPTVLPQYFVQLCRMYPSAYVFVVSYPGVCGWMGATPEVLLSSTLDGYETMALAGTRPAGVLGEWGEKEQREQQYVARYITDILRSLLSDRVDMTTYTKRAAQVEHLCTHFYVKMAHDAQVRDRLVAALHPTPAVAGTPTRQAMKVIKAIENHSRRYYGGYVGERYNDGRCSLYVNLRSMEFTSQAVRLYVGGGLTSQSHPLDEWNETCAKAQTLLSAFQ